MRKILSIFLTLAALVIVAFFSVACFGDDTAEVTPGGSSDSGGNPETTAPVNETITVSPGEVLKTSDFEITYNECGEFKDYSQYFPPKDGYKFIYIDLSVKNIGDSDASISYLGFNCYADGVAMDSKYEDDTISATLSSGRSTNGRAYFEVPIDAEKIEIEYEIDIWSGQKAIFVVQ